MRSDAELLRAWADGDQKSGRELFDRHYPALFRFFRNKVDRGIEDLVQDTLLACLRGADRMSEPANFRAYLFGTARNILRQHYKRKRVREDKLDFETRSLADLGAGPSTIVGERREHRLLLEGLRRIPIDAQITLELYLWEGLTGPELAEALGITEAAVRSRIFRAKERLREQLKALADSPEVLESTQSDLEQWAEQLRRLVEHPTDSQL